MIANIQQLVASFEKGRLTRRELIGALSALLFMPRQVSSAEALVPASTLNHVTLSVSDRARSKKFYEEVFGLTLAAAHANGDNMTVGKAPSFAASTGRRRAGARYRAHLSGCREVRCGTRPKLLGCPGPSRRG